MEGNSKPIGVILTMAELYRRNRPELPEKMAVYRARMEDAVGDRHRLHFARLVCTAEEYQAAVEDCADQGCSSILVVPTAYTPSGVAVDALRSSGLPVVILSTARDETLPVTMDAESLLANQAMHGAMDLAAVLRRNEIPFTLVAGHLSEPDTRRRLDEALRTACAAGALRNGTIAQIGGFFDNMLDFAHDDESRAGTIPFERRAIPPEKLMEAAAEVSPEDIRVESEWVSSSFELGEDTTDRELETSVRYSLALERLVEQFEVDGMAMNFAKVIESGAATLPFLGASKLLAAGYGYAGEGDILSAALVGAVARMAGEATFTEFFCPDFRQNQILLSHMGEANYAIAASPDHIRLVAKPFAWGRIERPLVPVFQMRPGEVTLSNISQSPRRDDSRSRFQLVIATGEIVRAPEHPELRVPYSRFVPSIALPEFLRRYSECGGIHHAALCYGDQSDALEALGRLCGLSVLRVR